MTFTILQSVYKNDKPQFLSECFESLARQTIPAKKIILVKDGNIPFELENIIKNWQTKLPITVVGYEENQGLAHALNYGLDFVDTEYVARMDSDDYCFPNRFEELLKFFNNNNNAVICGTAISEFYIKSNGEEIRKIRLFPKEVNKKSECLYRGTPLGHPTVMMKTELLKQFKYSESTSMNEDIDLWFRILDAGYTIYNIETPLLNFRVTDGTFARRSIKKAFAEYKIYNKYLKKFFGFSFKRVYPVARFITRFLPFKLNKKLYFSNLRMKILAK